MFSFNPFKSMTIQGAVGAVTPYVVNTFSPGTVGPKAQAVLTGVAVLWSVLGLRNAVAKSAGEAVAALGDGLLGKAGGR